MGFPQMEISMTSFVGPGSGSGTSSEMLELDFQPDSVVFGSHSGLLGTLREVTEDHPTGMFADLLDSVDVRGGPCITVSDEQKFERAENKYVALDDKVGWVRR